jgi:predicted naringenin-chalcone synthase
MSKRFLSVALHKIHVAFPTNRVAHTRSRDAMVKFIDSRPAHLSKQKQKLVDWFIKCCNNSQINWTNVQYEPEVIHDRSYNQNLVMDECFRKGEEMILNLKEQALKEAGIEEDELAAVHIGTEVHKDFKTLDVNTYFNNKCYKQLKSRQVIGGGCASGALTLVDAFHFLQLNPDKAVHVVNFDMFSRLWTCIFNNFIDENLPYINDDPEKFKDLCSSLMLAILVGDAASVTTMVGRRHRYFNEWTKQGYPYICGASEAVLSGTSNNFDSLARPYGSVPLIRQEVPKNSNTVIAEAINDLQTKFGAPKGFDKYCIYSGGPAVLEQTKRSLNLPRDLLGPAYKTLSEHGNCGSPTVMIQWKKIMETIPARRHIRTENGLLAAAGSGIKGGAIWWKRHPPPLIR